MSDKAQILGSFALVNETSNDNVFTFPLAEAFPPITGITKHSKLKRTIVASDGVVALNLGGVATLKGLFIKVVGGSITLKHNTNTNGLLITSGFVFFGTISALTIETVSTSEVEVEYVVFE